MMFKNKSQAQVSLDIATQRTGEKPVLASRVKDTPKSVVREYTEALLVALLLALFIRSFVVQAFKIPSGSMLSTLQVGDHILVNKFLYGLRLPYPIEMPLVQWGQPQRSDVIVFMYPKDQTKDFIKRVVAIGGDTIEVRHKKLFVNGQPADDPYAVFSEVGQERPVRDNFGPIEVPQDKLFVMGDNRDHSHDSRFWGFVDVHDVKGQAFLIYWSWDGVDRWIRWERLGSLIH